MASQTVSERAGFNQETFTVVGESRRQIVGKLNDDVIAAFAAILQYHPAGLGKLLGRWPEDSAKAQLQEALARDRVYPLAYASGYHFLANSTKTTKSTARMIEHAMGKNLMKSVAFVLLLLSQPTAWAVDPVRVAVFQGSGVGPSAKNLIATFEHAKLREFVIRRITADEIQDGKLSEVDRESGREAVRTFVREGGGFLGVCGGAYLATNDYSWALNLIDAKVVDRRMLIFGASAWAEAAADQPNIAFIFVDDQRR